MVCLLLLLVFLDPFQVGANLLLETEEVRQSVRQLNTEVSAKTYC